MKKLKHFFILVTLYIYNAPFINYFFYETSIYTLRDFTYLRHITLYVTVNHEISRKVLIFLCDFTLILLYAESLRN